MKKEARVLLEKALDSLILAIDHFNRPWDKGRVETVVILLDRAFELQLKAAIIHKGGKIRERRAKETIGFAKCVRKCLSDGKVNFLKDEEALTLQTVNNFRDAAQHYIVDLSEDELYLYSQAGVTLFGDILGRVFEQKLIEYLPSRVLPVSTSPPKDLGTLIGVEINAIKDLVKPGSRKRLEARAKVRPLAIMENSLKGERSQPSSNELNGLLNGIQAGIDWKLLFPGVASLNLETSGTGLDVSIRITKREGDPVRLVREGEAGADAIAVRKVNELDFYNLSTSKLADKLGLTIPKTIALVRSLALQDNPECFKLVKVDKSEFKRYSMVALERLVEALRTADMDDVWQNFRPRPRT